MYKTHYARTTFGSWDAEKVHAVVARSIFSSQNVQNTLCSDHFWKLRCRKSARRCGAKHISKSKCTKHTRSGPLLEVEMPKKCTPLWREAYFEVKMYKTHQVRTTLGSWDAEKVHAVVARSIFRSQNVQNTPGPDHFWKLRCRKSARRCGAKHISKSKCTKHQGFGPLLELEMPKKCTPLWREAYFEVKMYKTHQVRTTLGSWDAEKVHAVVARSIFRSQNVQNTPGPDHSWKLRCRKSARRCGAKHISKSKCTKHQGFGPLLELEMPKKCTPLWREAYFEVKMYKTHQVRTTLGSWDAEKVHAVVARSIFRSQNVQNTPGPDHSWKLRCRKSARRCGAKHISKSKCTKHTRSGPLLEVEMPKKCTPLWREAYFEVKMYKTHQVRTTLGSWDAEKVHAVVARSIFRSQNVQNTPGPDHSWKLRCRKSARRCGAKHISKSKCTKHTRSGPLLEVEMPKKCTPLWREAYFEVKMYKTHQVRTTLGSWDAEKVHAVVARSIFRSQNVQNTPGPDHSWKLRCRKSARRCGAKHISKSKCTKHTRSGPLLEVEMPKKCTPLWREAYFEVKMYKTHQVRTTLGSWDAEKVHAVVARSIFRSQNVQNTPGPDHSWKLRCRKSARRCGAKHISKSKCTKHTRSGPLLEVEMPKKCTPLWREAYFEVKMYKTRSGPLLEVEMPKKCTPLWREAYFEVKMYKTHQVRTTLGSWDAEKVHAVVARSIFRSQNVQNTPGPDHSWKLRCRKSARRCGAKHISKSKCTKHTLCSDHSWKLRCRKSARRCGAKHISKSKCTKHTRSGPLLEVEMSKKCTPLWRKAHFEVKMYKTHQVRTTFGGWDVEKVHAVVAQSTFRSQNVQNTSASDHIWKLRCRKSAHPCGAKHISKSKCTKHQGFGPLLEVQMSLRFASLQYTTLHYTALHTTTLHYITLHYTPHHYNYNYTTTLHYTPPHSTTLNYTTLHYTTLHYNTLHYATTTTTTTQLHSTTLHYTPLHSTTLHYTRLHYTPPHATALNYITLHFATLHYTTLPSTTLRYTTLHYTTTTTTTTQLHSTTLHYTPLHSTTLNYTKLHYTTLHSTTLHCTTLHSTTLHYTTLHYTEWHCPTDRQVDR